MQIYVNALHLNAVLIQSDRDFAQVSGSIENNIHKIFDLMRSRLLDRHIRAMFVKIIAEALSPLALHRGIDPGAINPVEHELAQIIQLKTEVTHHHPPCQSGVDQMQSGVIGIGMDSKTQSGHLSDGMV